MKRTEEQAKKISQIAVSQESFEAGMDWNSRVIKHSADAIRGLVRAAREIDPAEAGDTLIQAMDDVLESALGTLGSASRTHAFFTMADVFPGRSA